MYDVPKNKPSPLKEEFNAIDNENPSWGFDDFKSYAKEQFNDDGVAHTSQLLLMDWQWQADHMSFITASISGLQRSGKSRSFIYFGLMLGKIFGVPFTANDIYWNPFELMSGIERSVPRSTKLRDEDSRQKAGMMSGYVEDAISTYQDQLGKKQNNLLFAAVRKSAGSDLYRFMTTTIDWNENGVPKAFNVVLLTPHYDDPELFVWRGYLKVPNPNPEILEAYEKRKDEYLNNLKSRKGDYLADIDEMVEKVIASRENDLIKRNAQGLMLPVNNKLAFNAARSIIGTFRWTNQGTDIFVQRLKQVVGQKYDSYNLKVLEEIEQRKREAEEVKQDQFREAQRLLAERHDAKVKLALIQAEAEQKKQLLEEKRLALMEQKLRLDEQNRLAREKKILEDKNKEDDFAGVKKTLKEMK